MTVVLERRLSPEQIAKFSSKDLIRTGEKVERIETIQISAIAREGALVDEIHARSLGENMQLERGQLSPIIARARLDKEGEVVYDVIDGFHRTEGKRMKGEETIRATVLYGCSDEELYDQRILAASSVRSVQFARIAQWMTKSFEATPWAQKGLTVSNAFNIALNDSQRSNLANLTPEEIKRLKEWVKSKSANWQKSVHSTAILLNLVASSDPELVWKVRVSSGGKDREGKITPARLGIVAQTFPGRENFIIQRALLRVIVDKRYYATEAQVMVEKTKGLINSGMTEDQIYEIASNIKVIADIPSDESQEEELELVDPVQAETAGLNDLKILPAKIDLFQGGKRRHSEEIVHPVQHHNGATPIAQTTRVISEETQIPNVTELKVAQSRIRDLERELGTKSGELAVALGKVAELEGKLNSRIDVRSEAWWLNADYLVPSEREVMMKVMGQNRDLSEVAGIMRLTEPQILALIRSAYARRRGAIRDGIKVALPLGQIKARI